MVDTSSSLTVQELVEQGIIHPPMDGNHGEIHPKTADYVSSGIPFIMASDLINGNVDLNNCKYISPEQASSLRKGFAQTGDVLFSHKATIGRTAIVGELKTRYIVLTPQVTYYRILDDSTLNARYLKYYFDSPEFQQLFSSWAQSGSTRAYLGITAQLKLPIAVPPIDLQEAIAHILGILDDKIELNRKMNETLESIARAIFKSWFVHFDPVRAKMEGRRPYGMDKETAGLFPDSFENSELGEIPKGWIADNLYNFIEIIGGGTPKTSVPEYWDGKVPWFSVVDAPRSEDVWVIDTKKRITQKGLDSSSAQLLAVGTTIITARGTVGRTALVGISMAMNQSCYALRARPPLGDLSLYFLVQNLLGTLKQNTHGTVFDTITRDTFKGIAPSGFSVGTPHIW